jgi:hypothetical protein
MTNDDTEKHTPRDLERFTEENQQTLRSIYRRGHDDQRLRPKLQHKVLPASVGSPAAFSRWVNEQGSLSPQGHKDLVHHLAKHGLLDPRAKIHEALQELTAHPLFHALSFQLGIRLQTLSDVARRTVGTYRLWRPSLHWHERFVVGMLAIEESDEYAITVREVHRFKGTDRSIPQESVSNGYLLRKSIHYLVGPAKLLRPA